MLLKAKNAQQLITGPKLGGGGVRGDLAKSKSITFCKPSLIGNVMKIVKRRVASHK